MKAFLRNWNITRILRLVMGIIIIGQGLSTSQWLIVCLGVIFTCLPLLNIGCCSNTYCQTNRIKNTPSKKTEEVTFKEVK